MHFSIMLAIFAYYASIMLNAFTTLLCSKLCWHNRHKPTCSYTDTCTYIDIRTYVASHAHADELVHVRAE